MAFVQDEEEDKQLAGPQGPEGGPVQTSTPSGTLAGGAGAPGAPAGAAKPGGSFQGISSYLARNKPAAQRLGEQVGGAVRAKGDTARSTLETQQQAFNDVVGSKEVKQDAGLQNQILTDPTALSKNTADAARVKSMRDAAYTGPKTLEETDLYKPVSAAFGEAKRTGDLTNSAGGRMELIAGVAKPGSRITKGRLTLDEALVSGDAGAREAVSAGRDSLNDLNSRLQAASAASQGRATEAATTTNATRNAVRGALGTSRSNFETDLEGRLAAARTEATNRSTAAQTALKNATTQYADKGKGVGAEYADRAKIFGNRKDRALARGKDTFDEQALADTGLSREMLNEILSGKGSKTAGWLNDFGRGNTDKQDLINYGKYGNDLGDLSRFATTQSPEAKLYRENVASTDDFNRLAALNDLSGESSFFLDPTRAAEAGTANLDLTDFNLEGLSKTYQSAMQNAQKNAARTLATNRRSGSDSFVKKAGRSVLSNAIGLPSLLGLPGPLVDKGIDKLFARNSDPTELKYKYDDEELI